MAVPALRHATYEDVLRASDGMVAELIDGELWLSPCPGKPHAAAATALGEELGPPFKRGHIVGGRRLGRGHVNGIVRRCAQSVAVKPDARER
jgi:hypothetical protein